MFHDFFAAAAAVVGALIGLLFVAMSVIVGELFVGASLLSLHRLRQDQPRGFRNRSSWRAPRSSSASNWPTGSS
jgi:hypothetical protein